MRLKYIIPLLGWLAMSFTSFSQTASQNYVKTLTARDTLTGALYTTQDNRQRVQTDIVYIDGLGRTVQEVMQAASPLGKDIVKMYTYDSLGRVDKDYLPFAASTFSGAYQNNVLESLEGFYNAPSIGVDTINYPYSQTIFENSPLSRVIERSAPGYPWRSSVHGGSHVVSLAYQFNGANEIRLITVDDSNNQVMTATGHYDPNQLRGTLTTDEDGKKMLEYSDKAGKVVCKINAAGTIDETYTYYVYDDYDLLTFVIPPQAIAEIGSNWSLLNDKNFRNQWLFRYKYDEQNRMIEKQVPGAEKVEMVYDKRDRIVFTLDGNRRVIGSSSSNVEFVGSGTKTLTSYQGKSYLRAPGAKIILKKPGFQASRLDNFSVVKAENAYPSEWLFTKYDVLNRPVMTGIKSMVATRASLQKAIDNDPNYDFSVSYVGTAAGNIHGYDDTSYPSASGAEILTVSYFDNYRFIDDLNWEPNHDERYSHSGHYTQTQGLATGGLIRILGSNPVRFLKSVTYYDDRLRPQATITENYFSGADKVVTTYRNKVSALIANTVTTHQKDNTSTTVTKTFTYDHRDRLLTHTHKIDDNPTITLASNTYNAIGQLIEKDLHDTSTPAQSLDYRYNERGWITTINGGSGTLDDPTDQFGLELKYHDAPAANYNGNIGQMLWKSKGGGLTEAAQNYQYTYDSLNRLISANHTGVGNFDVSNITYDKNGNIQTLQRNTIDDLDYDYLGNQLTRVEDATSNTQGFKDVSSTVGTREYSYDPNGNMVRDTNKGLSNIQYNYLNLPRQVTLNNGKTIQYIYDAAGIKHRKTFDGKEWTYVGAFHYEKEASESVADLEFIQHAEGRALKSGSNWNYQYNLTDHLGNVRVTVNEFGNVVQRDGYYPFGLTFNGYNQSPKNNYLYNQGFGEKTFQGKNGTMFKVERQPELGIDLTKFRAYDPALGRWWQIDPASDMVGQESWTPYHYAFNNPVLYNDPYGDCPECFDLSNIGKGFREAGSRVSRRARAAGDAISKGANSLRTSVAQGASNIGQGFSQLGSTAKANAKKRLNQLRSFLKENIDGAFSGNEPDTRGTGDGTSFGGFEFVKTSGPTGSQGVQGNPEGQMDVTDIASVKSPGSLGTTGSGAPGGLQAGAEFIKDVGGTVNQLIDIAQSGSSREGTTEFTNVNFISDSSKVITVLRATSDGLKLVSKDTVEDNTYKGSGYLNN